MIVITLRMSAYSSSDSISRFAFLCQGALSMTKTILSLSLCLICAINSLMLAIVVS